MVGEQGAGRLLGLFGCGIPAPLVVAADVPSLLECVVHTTSGEVKLTSVRDQTKVVQRHFQAVIGSVSGLNGSPVLASAAGLLAPLLSSACRLATLLHVPWHPATLAGARIIRCRADVSLERHGRGNGWVSHPAVTDSMLQLGPATADVGKEDSADVTRVVAGMAACVAAEKVSMRAMDC